MDRLASMLDRLPPIYTIEKGTLVHDLLAIFACEIASFDEDLDRVQRSHWLGEAFDRDDLEKISALAGLPGAPWEPDALYRARIEATTKVRLRGSVTRADLELVLTRILAAAQQSMGVRYLQILPDGPGAPPVFGSDRSDWVDAPAFVEFPPVTRRSDDLVARHGLLRPLDQFVATNRGKDPAALEGVIRGVAGSRTAAPLLVNLTTGAAFGYDGLIPAGAELRFSVGAGGGLQASVDGVDVTSHLFTTSAFPTTAAGPRFEPLLPDPSPQPIVLARGDNTLWFLSIALFDRPGLDAALLGLATPDMTDGVWSDAGGAPAGRFDLSVFHQQPAAVLDAWWVERSPASFRFDVPAGAVQRVAGLRAAPEDDRSRLFGLLGATVNALRAAGVVGEVRPLPLVETQRMSDRCSVIGASRAEVTSPGADRVSLGALFDTTAIEGSRLG